MTINAKPGSLPDKVVISEENSNSDNAIGGKNIKDNADVDTPEEEISYLITLSKTPTLVAPFTAITKLDLFQANLSSLPSALPQYLPNLSILFCMKNNFTSVPAVIGACPKLQMVSFKSNHITMIEPEALQPQMRWLILTDNKIQSLPGTIGRCTKLQKFMLSGNQLTELPSEISNCTNLELIRLASNHLKEAPLGLLKLPKLSWVALSDNPFLSTAVGAGAEPGDVILKVIDDSRLDDPNQALSELGRGASGITRKYKYSNLNKDDDGGGDGDDDEVAVKEYYSNITSDGNPQEERKVAMVGSSLGCQSLINVIGMTPKGNLIMELLSDYAVLANPPSLESCSRDTYPSGSGDNNDDCNPNPLAALTSQQAVHMVQQLVYTLMKLHEKGIMHGDLYGHNILVSTKKEKEEESISGRVWLTDFGAAFFYDTSSGEFGRLLEKVERRALGHLVGEIADLISVDENGSGAVDANVETDVDTENTMQTQQQLLRDFGKHCDGDGMIFSELQQKFISTFS
mmetsp:Transcript_3241/g.4779  ORF Transcript_3241/g.4779 Transcript_3241/m.4779 type:complete len:516 (-) Transcript_3241:474-2021(-)